MAYPSAHQDRLWRSTPLKRVVGFVFVCALFSLLWFGFGSKTQLRKTFDRLSKQAAQSAASVLSGDKRPEFDARPHHVTTPSKNVSFLAPFPTLPTPDNEEYMAICMADQYCRAYSKDDTIE